MYNFYNRILQKKFVYLSFRGMREWEIIPTLAFFSEIDANFAAYSNLDAKRAYIRMKKTATIVFSRKYAARILTKTKPILAVILNFKYKFRASTVIFQSDKTRPIFKGTL